MNNGFDLDSIRLTKGEHVDPTAGMCVMEAVSLAAGEPFGHTPSCMSPVIRSFLVEWNDALDDIERQQLKRHIPNLVGTVGPPERETTRASMALDWLVRVQAPAWLRLANLGDHADRLAALSEVTPKTRFRVEGPLHEAMTATAALWHTVHNTNTILVWAGVTGADVWVWDTAWDTVTASGSDAAHNAAYGDTHNGLCRNAQSAVINAAEIVATNAAGNTPQHSPQHPAVRHARDTARDTGRDTARDTVCAAARDALTPTKVALQADAHRLIETMIAA